MTMTSVMRKMTMMTKEAVHPFWLEEEISTILNEISNLIIITISKF
jgi:hypothetical protein